MSRRTPISGHTPLSAVRETSSQSRQAIDNTSRGHFFTVRQILSAAADGHFPLPFRGVSCPPCPRLPEGKAMMGIHVHEIYCNNPRCNVRGCIVRTKDHGDQPDPKHWRCPGCGQPATIHWQRTARDHEQRTLESAIGTVNSALYERDHGPAVPAPIMCLRTLPESWKVAE